MATRHKNESESGVILPDALYRRSTALRALGLGGSTLRRARRAGIELFTLQIGREPLVRGRDVIAFVELLAALDAQKEKPVKPALNN